MILDRILEHKRAELRHKQSRSYLADLKAAIRDAPPVLGFAVTLDATRSPTSPALIAEIKKASPSLGLLREEFSEHVRLSRACAHIPGAWGSGPVRLDRQGVFSRRPSVSCRDQARTPDPGAQ